MNDAHVALLDARGPLTDLLKKLSGNDGQQWLDALKRFNRKENPWEVKPVKAAKQEAPFGFPALPLRHAKFVLDLPVYASKEAFIEAVKKSGYLFTEGALSVVAHDDWELLTEGGKYGFWEYTVRELTGKNEVKTPVFYEAIHAHKFIDAPHQSTGDLGIAYIDRSHRELMVVISDPIPDPAGIPAYLQLLVRDSGGSLVLMEHARPDDIWYGNGRVLVCRKLD